MNPAKNKKSSSRAKAVNSPVVGQGIFAVLRSWYFDVGGLDPDLELDQSKGCK